MRLRSIAALLASATLLTVGAVAAPAAAQTDPNELVTAARDWDGDGHPDLAALTTDGRLYVYRTQDGYQFKGKPVLVASGLRGFTSVRLAGDLDEDGSVDILARRAGTLWVVRGTPEGRFGGLVQIAGNWSSYEEVVPVDLDVDGKVDLIGFDHPSGSTIGADSMRVYVGRAGVAFRFGNLIPLSGSRFDSMSAFGDSDRDGYQELLVRNRATGELWVLETNRTFTVLQHKSQHRVLATLGPGLPTLMWFGTPLNVVVAAGDVTGDGVGDVFHLQRNHDWVFVTGKEPGVTYEGNWIFGSKGWAKLMIG